MRKLRKLRNSTNQHIRQLDELELLVTPLEPRVMLAGDFSGLSTAGTMFAITDFTSGYGASTVGTFHATDHDDDHDDHDEDGVHSLPYVEMLPDGAQGDSVVWDSYDLSQTFNLNSLAGADHVIYLDFDGHTTEGTLWNSNFNGNEPIVTPAYGGASLSDAELSRIQRIWARVSEDFAPFNVNVTTEDPGVEALRKSGGGDSEWGVRVVIGDNTFYDPSGGVAYVNSFDWNTDTPAFVFNTSEIGVAEAASHEVGHALGLRHDGQGGSEYYGGHGSGVTSWGPIMGASYNVSLTQWSRGEYSGATRGENDLSIITSGNGFDYRTDDFGDSQAAATALLNAGATTFETTFGLIEQNTDSDYFSFFAGAGSVDINVDPLAFGANLDILAELYDSSGNLVSSSNPVDEIDASFNFDLADSGQYFLSVTGTGAGDPSGDGYSDYGSLGNYRITGSVTAYSGDPADQILVRASGDEGTEQFSLQIDGQTVATYFVGTTFETFVYQGDGSIAADQIRIVFAGDQFDAANDINTNLNVDWIEVGGDRFQTEDASVFSTATWVDGFLPGYGRGQTLHSDGYFQFAMPANGSDLTLAEGVKLTTRRLTINLDQSDSPLVINMTDRTVSTADGTMALPDSVRRVVTTGNGGNDEIFIVGSVGDDLARVRTNRVTSKGTDLFVLGRKFEAVRLYESLGFDKVVLGNQNGLTYYDYGFSSADSVSIVSDGNDSGGIGGASQFGSGTSLVTATGSDAGSSQEQAYWMGQTLTRHSEDQGFDLDDEEVAGWLNGQV